eukprot:TRINITY_DN25810_c0_g2_i2.p1 TRINITY_DN25810_c0_g2~~TRINITY_DN25810_c0_g2_i2.p1  ORF type:complete len:1034 (-),score=212.39 TRINITY_DN25810_c0_g2_i2:75-3176(-)
METYSDSIVVRLKVLSLEVRSWIRCLIFNQGADANGEQLALRTDVADLGPLGAQLLALACGAAELVYCECFSQKKLEDKRQAFDELCQRRPSEVAESLWLATQRYFLASARLECGSRLSPEDWRRCQEAFEESVALVGLTANPGPTGLGCAFGPADRITYITDVEGHWAYFCNFVDLAKGVKFVTAGDHRDARHAADLELELQDGWHFVFGGDSCDKGPGTLRFLEAMVRLKRKYPSRVHLLIGNRDANKLRWTAELDEAELDRFDAVPPAYWVPERARVSHAQHLRSLAASEEGCGEDDVTQEMIELRNTKANKLKYMLKYDMGSDGEFEFRRQELAHLREIPESEISDAEVVESYEAQMRPGGWMYEFLHLAQLGVILGDALFVHGQIIGNQFPPDQVRGADADSVACCLGVVPDRTELVEDVHQWLEELNAWYYRQLEDWRRRPLWETRPTLATYESWSARGGAELVAYGCPGCRVPTVVYCRWLTPRGMPLRYPQELVRRLERAGLRFVVVGHTPHGNVPTVIPNSGVTVIMGDTSFSQLKANVAYSGDNRGTAVSEVMLVGGRCMVRGLTEDERIVDYAVEPSEPLEEGLRRTRRSVILPADKESDPFVGHMQSHILAHKQFFVKARLPPAPGVPDAHYLLAHIDGFRYDYALLSPEEVASGLSGDLTMPIVKRTVSTTGVCFGHSFEGTDADHLLAYLFAELDRDGDGMVVKKELLTAFTDKLTRDALLWSFPGMSIDDIIKLMDKDHDGGISLAELRGAVETASLVRKIVDRGGIQFSAILEDDVTLVVAASTPGDTFPDALGPFVLRATRHIRPADLRIYLRQRAPSFASSANAVGDSECEVEASTLQVGSLSEALPLLPHVTAGAALRSYVTQAAILPALCDRLKAAGAPAETEYVAWCYPFIHDWDAVHSGGDALDPDLAMLRFGAFVAYGADPQVPIGLISVTPFGWVAAEEASSACVLRFGTANRLAEPVLQELVREDRLHPVTFRHMVEAGATDFCWVGSSSTSEGAPFAGYFAYVGNIL